jgi:hypothetical protein
MAGLGDWSWQVSVETALKTLSERKRNLENDAETLRTTVKASFDQLRRHLDEQEARLLSGVEEQVSSSRRQLDDSEANVTSLRARLSEGADGMNRAVAVGDVNGVVMQSKRLEDASVQLREAEAVIAAMDTSLGGTLPIEAAENAVKNLQLSGARAPGLGSSSYMPSSPPSYNYPQSSQSYPQSSWDGGASLPSSTPVRAAPVTPATGETVPNAIYVNGVPHDASEADVRQTFERFGEIKMVNARHINTGGFAFVFFKQDIGAQVAQDNPRVVINGKTANVLAKKQILGGVASS